MFKISECFVSYKFAIAIHIAIANHNVSQHDLWLDVDEK